MTTRIELTAGPARVTLLPAVGGALAAFAWNDTAVLRPMYEEAIATGNVRLASSYPLVPYSNRIAAATLVTPDSQHALLRNFGDHPHAIHGVGWQRAWTVEFADPGSARITLTHVATGDACGAWPWSFAATQTFALSRQRTGATLAATLTLRNRSDRAFPFGLGWHPFFACSAATTLQFDAAGVWHNDSTQLPLRWTPVPAEWDFAAAPAVAGLSLDNVFTGWRGRAVLLDAQTGLRTTIHADTACRFLVVYSPAPRDFIAIEPVTHQTDAFNRSARGESGTGTRVLPPGAAFSCTMRITVEDLRAT